MFHDDRDIEFIQFKRWLERLYANTEGGPEVLELDHKSCEMIADELSDRDTNKISWSLHKDFSSRR